MRSTEDEAIERLQALTNGEIERILAVALTIDGDSERSAFLHFISRACAIESSRLIGPNEYAKRVVAQLEAIMAQMDPPEAG